MSAQPSEPGGHDLIRPGDQVIRVGGQDAAVIPLDELRRLRAIEAHAPAGVVAEAEAGEAARRQRFSDRWNEILASATPEQRAWAEREAARLASLNR